KDRRRIIRIIAFGGSCKSSTRAKKSRLKRFRGHRTTQISRVHRSRLLRRRPAGCSSGTVAAFAAVSFLEKSLGSMRRSPIIPANDKGRMPNVELMTDHE